MKVPNPPGSGKDIAEHQGSRREKSTEVIVPGWLQTYREGLDNRRCHFQMQKQEKRRADVKEHRAFYYGKTVSESQSPENNSEPYK